MAHYEPAVAALVAADIKPGERLLSTGEVAALVRVDPATATHWCTSGKLPHATTPGGHRRVAYRHLMEVLEQVA